ncbi:YdhR family protein [Aestuariispira ectoiniformans]|uniref:YdhR family protein n=1 Tax=Aestuariispira ectoiniformans TaxID=2775080 RepID=UPI00223BDDCF|nr:YdhR family protein [Aestuariispira ectoiniformans]
MRKDSQPLSPHDQHATSRRTALKLGAAGAASLLLTRFPAFAGTTIQTGEDPMQPGAFVYTELQITVPFSKVPWNDINTAIKAQPGFLNKTWFSGLGNQSAGGIYAFDTVENAQKFVTDYFPREARNFGVAQTTRVFDAAATADASLDMNSVHYGPQENNPHPKAFVYTEVQVSVPFEQAPWQDRNPVLRQQPGLLSKTWLSGLHTHTVGGVDAFDSIANARAFAIDDFPKTAKAMNAAYYTRIFDASVTEDASIAMNSPYYL